MLWKQAVTIDQAITGHSLKLFYRLTIYFKENGDFIINKNNKLNVTAFLTVKQHLLKNKFIVIIIRQLSWPLDGLFCKIRRIR